MMDLVDRYMKAVGVFLPRVQRGDIVQELTENLRAQLDDREAALGRPLTEAEQEAMLQQHGPPMLVAERYLTQGGTLVFGRQLIGRTLFPFYVAVLGIACTSALVIRVGLLVALATGGTRLTGDTITSALLIPFVTQVVIVTGIFAAVDRIYSTTPWRAGRPAAQPAAGPSAQRVPRSESIAQLVALLIMLGWLLAVIATPSLLFGPVAGTYKLGPVWQQIALPTLLIVLASVVQAVVNLVRPDWTGVRLGVRLGTDLATFGIIAYLLVAGQWVVRIGSVGSVGSVGTGDATLRTINSLVYRGLWFAVAVDAIVLLVHLWPLARQARKRGA